MEDFVSFEIAKKLKEKGYPQDIQHCIGWYPTEYYKNSCIGEYFEGELQEIEDYYGDRISAIHIIENEKKGVIAPTIPQVLKWLREKDIMVEIIVNLGDNGVWQFAFRVQTKKFYERATKCDYTSYESAALFCIEYIIDNLI